jgi:hypothetical protein
VVALMVVELVAYLDYEMVADLVAQRAPYSAATKVDEEVELTVALTV